MDLRKKMPLKMAAAADALVDAVAAGKGPATELLDEMQAWLEKDSASSYLQPGRMVLNFEELELSDAEWRRWCRPEEGAAPSTEERVAYARELLASKLEDPDAEETHVHPLIFCMPHASRKGNQAFLCGRVFAHEEEEEFVLFDGVYPSESEFLKELRGMGFVASPAEVPDATILAHWSEGSVRRRKRGR